MRPFWTFVGMMARQRGRLVATLFFALLSALGLGVGLLSLAPILTQIVHPEDGRGLNAIAPTVAVRGNVDRGDFGATLPMNECVEIGKRTIYLYHIREDLDIDPVAAEVDLVITGHSHQPALDEIDGVTYLNPGSCGPHRFSLPVALAFLTVTREGFDIEQVELDVT